MREFGRQFSCRRAKQTKKPNTKRNNTMTNHAVRFAACALLPAALFAFTSCSSMKGTEETVVFETPDGAMIINTITVAATVTAIDAANRKVTLTQADNKNYTYKAGPNLNLSKLSVGDQV